MSKKLKPKFRVTPSINPSSPGKVGIGGSHLDTDIRARSWVRKKGMPPVGNTGGFTSSIVGAFGTGALSVMTADDIEDWEDKADTVGQAGDYASDYTSSSGKRNYVKKGGGKPMIGEQQLRKVIREIIMAEAKDGSSAFAYEIQVSEKEKKEEEENLLLDEPVVDENDSGDIEEFSGAGGVSGAITPLGTGPDGRRSKGFDMKPYYKLGYRIPPTKK